MKEVGLEVLVGEWGHHKGISAHISVWKILTRVSNKKEKKFNLKKICCQSGVLLSTFFVVKIVGCNGMTVWYYSVVNISI